MTRMRLLAALGFALAVLALLASLPFARPLKSPLEANYDRVQPGMTEEEVLALLGDACGGVTGGVVNGPRWTTSLDFTDWETGVWVRVDFGDGRVIRKRLGHTTRITWWQALRNRLGW